MSLTIGSISGSFDDFSLPDDEQNSGQLGDKKVNDFTKIPFYKNKRFIQVIVIAAGIALTCLWLWAAFYWVIPRYGDDPLSFLFVGYSVLPMLVSWIFLLIYRGYEDPQSRQVYRLELENDKVSALQFINKHGWENIRRLGFFIPKDQQPLCTKEMLAQKVFNEITGKQFWNYICTQQLISSSSLGSNRLMQPRIPFICYQISRPTLWDCINHHIFTDEQLATIIKTFEFYFKNLSGAELLANWRYVKEVSFDKNPLFKGSYEWLEKNQERYEQIESLYVQKASYFLGKISNSVYPFILFHWRKDAPKVSEELVKTLPAFHEGWFPGNSGYINNLNALNKWFEGQLKEFDNEFKTLLV